MVVNPEDRFSRDEAYIRTLYHNSSYFGGVIGNKNSVSSTAGHLY